MEYQRVMNDYKKLIAKLRFYADTADNPIYGICINSPKVMLQAADTIEQLVKECNIAVADIEEVIHDDFGDICTICNKYKSCMKTTTKTPLAKLPCERGKWRGVREVDE